MQFITCLGLALALSACAHYQSVSQGYRGPGPFTSNVRESGPPQPPRRELARAKMTLSWPVTRVRLNRGFSTANAPHHYGVDLGGKKGTPIYAAHPGKVIYVGSAFNGFGNMILVEYDKRWASLYAHLDTIIARPGQIVGPGDQIGTMGQTGVATGVHLHFELMRDRQPIDPATYLPLPPQKLASR